MGFPKLYVRVLKIVLVPNMPAIIFLIFRDFLIFYQFFLSLQVKWCPIIIYAHGIYELPHELENNLSLRILGNEEISGKCLNPIEW